MTPKALKALQQAAEPDGLRLRNVHGNTVNALVEAGLAAYAIRYTKKYRLQIHVIVATEAGRALLAERGRA